MLEHDKNILNLILLKNKNIDSEKVCKPLPDEV